MVKILMLRTAKKLLYLSQNLNAVVLPWSTFSKGRRQNGKQHRLISDLSEEQSDLLFKEQSDLGSRCLSRYICPQT